MKNGYVCLWRKSIDSMVFANPELWKLWCLCLMKASHKKCFIQMDGRSEPVKLLPGQFITGRYALHKDYYIKKKKTDKSPLTVWRWLQILEKCENLNIKNYNKFSIITITNWRDYQFDEQQTNNRRTTDEQQTNTNNNVDNVDNVNKEIIEYPEWLNLELWKNYKDDRKERKSKMTKRAEILNINKLKKLIDKGYDQEKIINQSIERGWKGLFEPKENFNNNEPYKLFK